MIEYNIAIVILPAIIVASVFIIFTHREGITPEYSAKYKLIICETDTEEMKEVKKRLVLLRKWIFSPINWWLYKEQVCAEIKALEDYILTHTDTQAQEQTEKRR